MHTISQLVRVFLELIVSTSVYMYQVIVLVDTVKDCNPKAEVVYVFKAWNQEYFSCLSIIHVPSSMSPENRPQ